ncbi:bifunctional phosphoglucose/phosphomannose isomerase [bacterium]|nr:bifunctional phosphoglucose/phosphomannose isomerase [bacterium]
MSEWPEGGLGEMFRLIGALPEQMERSAALAGLDEIGRAGADLRRIVLCGMGGSAIAGDLVQPLLQAGRVSLTVWRDYGLPHWVDADDLVLCCSYSGNTEESLSGARRAGELGCARIAVSSGGELTALAGREHFPVVALPGGLPPRASLGFGLGALVRVLERLGVVPGGGGHIHEAAALLRGLDAARRDPMAAPAAGVEDGAGNPSPADLATILAGRVPVIYTAGLEAHAAGLRLKAQLNENSKMPACLAAFPELDHNDLVGWALAPEQRERFVLIILRGPDDNERTAPRVEITRDLLWDEFADVHEIRAAGETPLARVMSLVQYGDYLSCHLAHRNGVDPVPVDRISKLKTALG